MSDNMAQNENYMYRKYGISTKYSSPLNSKRKVLFLIRSPKIRLFEKFIQTKEDKRDSGT
jgi:hypothetical protein